MKSSKSALLRSVSLIAFAASLSSNSYAQVTYDTSSNALTGATNTSLDGNGDLITNGEETDGASLTGSNTGIKNWTFTDDGDLSSAGANPAFLTNNSAGGQNIIFDGVSVSSSSIYGVMITTSGTASTSLTLNNGASVTSGSGFDAIYINSSSDESVDITIDADSSVTNNSGTAAINYRSAGDTQISSVTNRGEISGGTGTGHGINVESNAGVSAIYNLGDGSITGGALGSSFGIRILSDGPSDSGLIVYNTGTITGGESFGAAILLAAAGKISTLTNYGTIESGGGSSNAITSVGASSITTINNYATGTLSGGGSAIYLTNTAADGMTINTAGTIVGDIQLGSESGSGDILNIYDGTITGDILAADDSGSYGTVNFNLVGGSFGYDGGSDSGVFSTTGTIGSSSTQLLAANFNSGVTTLNNNLYAATTTLASGATLTAGADDLTMTTDFVNNGVVNLGANNLNVTGDISGSGTVNLTVESGTSGSHGYITNSGGTVNVANMTFVPTYGSGDIVAGEELVIVANPDSLTLNSTAMQSLNGVSWTLSEAAADGTDYHGVSYSAGSLMATSTLIVASTSAVNGPSVSALSSYSGSDTEIDAMQAGLTNNTDHNKAGAQLRPEASGGNIITALNVVNQSQESIFQHLNNYDSSDSTKLGTGFWVSGLGMGDILENKQRHLLNLAGTQNNASSRAGEGFFGSHIRQGVIAGTNGYEADSYGISFGGDGKVKDDLRVGASFTYAASNIDETGDRAGSGSEIESYFANLYTRYQSQDKWYLDSVVTVGKHNYQTTRLVNYVGNTTATGEFDSEHFGINMQLKKPFSIGKHFITPYIGGAYNSMQQQGYKESGAGGANLVVDDSNVNSLRATVGVKGYTTYKLGSGNLKPGFDLAYKRELNDDLVPDQSVSFAGGGVSFVTPGLELEQDFLVFGADLEFISKDDVKVSLAYDGEYGNSYLSNTVNLALKYKF